MLLVLVVHADFYSLGRPTVEEMTNNIGTSYMRLFIEALSIGCVNMFVLLSGWFGIHPKWKSFLKFVYQCLFFAIGIYVVSIVLGQSQISLKGIAECFCLLKWSWFIRAYILLYLLAPILNAYLEKATKTQHQNLLIGFFLFQTTFSWTTGAAKFFEHGYSTISFIGLYLLARYCAIYKNDFHRVPKRVYLLVYIGIGVVLALSYYASEMLGVSFLSRLIYQYDNPFVIVASLSLLLYFSRIPLKSKVINWIGASSFAVFLFHMNPHVFKQYYIPAIQTMYNNNDGMVAMLFILLVIIVTYVLSILIDQPRILTWEMMSYDKNSQ